VPCSGTGTLARNPEIRHHLRPEDLSRQAIRQRKILSNALQQLAPGGRLIYSTCSLEPEENEAVVQQVLARHRGIQRLPIQTFLTALAHNHVLSRESEATLLDSAIRNNSLRTLPGVQDCDGFFCTILERN
jgi:16S rRNA (cytosine967-C5)-methyltransferase